MVLSEKHYHLADDWFLKQTKKGTSYFDCYNMALLDRYKNHLTFYDSSGNAPMDRLVELVVKEYNKD